MAQARKKLMLLGWIAAVLLILLTSATYAWLGISSNPTVSDLALSVVTDNALELAPDVEGVPGEWGTILNLSELSALTAPLKPATYLAAEGAFYAPNYGWDGRVDFSAPIRLTDQNGALFSSADAAEEAEGNGYLFVSDFWVRAQASDCIVTLTPAVEREDGVLGSGTFVVGEPVWDENHFVHKESGNGAQYAIRMAFRVDETDDHGNVSGEPIWIFYEPCVEEGEAIAGADGSESFFGSHKVVRQLPSQWSDLSPALRDTVNYQPGQFLTEDLSLFAMEAGHARHITLYIWLEGQDEDCTNAISEGRIFSNIQFSAVATGGEQILRPE